MRVTSLHRYPVKSLQGESLEAAAIERTGLAGDRRWLVVDAAGRFVTRRERPQMAGITALPAGDGLVLRHAGRELHVACPGPDAAAVEATVWRDHVPARLASQEAADWLSEALGAKMHLVHMADPDVRRVDAAYGAPDDRVSFADGFPVLLTSQGSLAALNALLPEPMVMRRFRPNIVVEGADAWVEDEWRRLRIGMMTFRVVKPCSRCVIVTQDPDSGDAGQGNEPLATLRRMGRMAKGGIMFGQNLIPDEVGEIRIGDVVEPLETGPSNLVRPVA
ncbi:MOSC domain-containing protein [Flavisphingomonas formosensis]|uniref:MOSC domain-containing protein n=1 Tax=Flavisphingomonas formosensis TaxID=861534 RepID=UPI0012FB5AFA|nr:MOSC domain-containing protein [Sphingomonas formosensis]